MSCSDSSQLGTETGASVNTQASSEQIARDAVAPPPGPNAFGTYARTCWRTLGLRVEDSGTGSDFIVRACNVMAGRRSYAGPTDADGNAKPTAAGLARDAAALAQARTLARDDAAAYERNGGPL